MNIKVLAIFSILISINAIAGKAITKSESAGPIIQPISEVFTCPSLIFSESNDFNKNNSKMNGTSYFASSDATSGNSELFNNAVPAVLSFACGVHGEPLPNGYTQAEYLTCCLSLQLHAGQNPSGGFVGFNSQVYYKKKLDPSKKCIASGKQFICYQ